MMEQNRFNFDLDFSFFGFGLRIHNKDQWDLANLAAGETEVYPLVCIGLNKPNKSIRIFCLWDKGIQLSNKIYKW